MNVVGPTSMNTGNIYYKINGATTSDQEHLCKTCTNGCVIKLTNNSMYTYCHNIGNYIKSNVAECGAYYNKTLPSKQSLYETAWILETKKTGREIGFKKYTDWKRDNPNSTEVYDD